MSAIEDLKEEIGEEIDKYPLSTRWDIASAMLSENRAFFSLMARIIDAARIREGRLIRPICIGTVGALLLGNWNDGGFLYADGHWSYPGWLGSEETVPVVKYGIAFVGYEDELPALRDAAESEGIYIFEEHVLKSTIHLEQP